MPDTKKTFSLDDVEEDNFTDEIGVLIKAFQKIPTHTHKKIELISHLKKVGLQTGYIEFRGFTHKFHIGRIGQSYLYDVPLQKTGHLRRFRGKKIRVACIESGPRWVRQYMAGERDF